MARRSHLLSALLVLVANASLSAQRVWVVAPEPGPGVDFTDIQPAIDAAADFDTVVVRAGSYSGFAIDAKALFVHADGAVRVLSFTGPVITVSDTGAVQPVVVRGFTNVPNSQAGILVTGCQGAVLLEDCTINLLSPSVQVAKHGALVIGSPRVTFAGCTLISEQSPFLQPPAAGLTAMSSRVTVHGSQLLGGDSIGLAPGDGAQLTASFLVASGATIQGGEGDPGFSSLGQCLQQGTRGGVGLGLDATSSVFALDTTIAGGSGGGVPPCIPQPAGARISGAGTVTEVAGPAAALTAESPAPAGQTVTLALTGTPGASAFLLVSPLHNPFFMRGCNGTLDIDLALSLTVPLGVVPASGEIALPLTVPDPLGFPSLNLYLQAVTTLSGGCFLGRTTALLLVDA
jgi:hypothetical protein